MMHFEFYDGSVNGQQKLVKNVAKHEYMYPKLPSLEYAKQPIT